VHGSRFSHLLVKIILDTTQLITLDKKHLWHPFTPMEAWCAAEHDPVVLERGVGVWLWDTQGRRYLDGNSSIWTNIHGHSHPTLQRAVDEQLGRLAHASFLGLTHAPAIQLAERLTRHFPPQTLTRVFYSDDGSTAVECALKMAVQYWQMLQQPERCEFLAFDQAYHGDTLGAASLGGIPAFHGRFQHLGLRVHHVRSPDYLAKIPEDIVQNLAGVIIEPLIQGAAGMRLWPEGSLLQLRHWCDAHNVFLIADEVMTGFGRTGTLFACDQEGVVPDFMALAKGLTGGLLPLAATLTTERVFEAFLGPVEERRTFYYGHSYCGNPLGCAAALANLEIFHQERTLEHLPEKAAHLGQGLKILRQRCAPYVGEIRQIGLIAGIDIVKDARTEAMFPWQSLTGARICQTALAHGLLTRPIKDTLVFMPPLSITLEEIDFAMHALEQAICETLNTTL
jgi:adenosylmethionine-8-amino-7-oxononanoate aminotransferase